MSDLIFRLLGVVMLVLGVLGFLSYLGPSNPVAFISDSMNALASSILSPTAVTILWFLFILLGLTLVGPKEGYTKKIVELRS